MKSFCWNNLIKINSFKISYDICMNIIMRKIFLKNKHQEYGFGFVHFLTKSKKRI